MSTFGEVEDFKHFLPRILELYTRDFYGGGYDFGLFLSKLEYAKWYRWPVHERDVVVQTVRAWLQSLDPSERDSNYEPSVYEEAISELSALQTWRRLADELQRAVEGGTSEAIGESGS